jgi:hypothetical protein
MGALFYHAEEGKPMSSARRARLLSNTGHHGHHVMAGITQLANSCSSAGCGLMHLASEACTALLEITLSCATVRNSKHTACSVGDVPFFSGRAAAFRRARSSMHARKQAVLLLKSMGTCERTLLGSISRYQAFMVEL